jgi:tetratricopeptide (TPR) repeat protein
MAIPIEGYSVVAQRSRIQHLLDAGQIPLLNATVLADDHLWRCSFMTSDDANHFVKSLASLGLVTSVGPDSDVVVVSEFDRSVEPYCEWLQMAEWEKAVIAWLVGTEPRTIVAREGWDPKVGSGLTFRAGTDGLEFVRLDGNVEVYRDKISRKELFIGRTSTPSESLFKAAGAILSKCWRAAGEPPVTGTQAEDVVRAVAMLDQILAEVPDQWRVHWLHGKGHIALGNTAAAYESFKRAFALEQNDQAIPRELAGACLELGKFAEGVQVAERAVAIQPDNHELLGNLAVAQLLAGNLDAAQKTIHAANRINSGDQINQFLLRVIQDVVAGRRPPPKSTKELQSPLPPPPTKTTRKFWQFWKS